MKRKVNPPAQVSGAQFASPAAPKPAAPITFAGHAARHSWRGSMKARWLGLSLCGFALAAAVPARAAAPANDNFASPLVLFNTLLTNTVNANNQNGTKELGEPNHAGNAGGRSVWWMW